MYRDKIGFVLLTKWAFEATEDADAPSIISTGDVVGEKRRPLDSCTDPCTGSVNKPDIGSLDELWEGDESTPEEDLVGGWIVETQEGTRKELDLLDPYAPSKDCIARSYELHKLPHLLWL